MKKVAITGNICSGKSFVLKVINKLGHSTFSSDDAIKNKLYRDKTIIKTISKEFPSSVDLEGNIDRESLATSIFNNKKKKEKLENIVYPALKKLIKKALYKTSLSGKGKIFYEIPLLFEKNLEKEFDKIILVKCSKKMQKTRALKRKNMSLKRLNKILSYQTNDCLKIRKVNFIINTNLSKFDTISKTKSIIKKI